VVVKGKVAAAVQVDYVAFKGRAERSRYIVDRFARFLKGKVLDVGCDEAVLRSLLPDVQYTGVDIGGDPDVRLDLEEIAAFPFADGQFDCVVCADVLEHLDNLHHVFGELVRVAGAHVLLSLPNNWANARRPVEKGKGRIGHYGLPARPPQDRHKWFFGLSEAIEFVKAQQAQHPISVAELRVTEKPRPWVVRMARRLRYGSQERYLNRYAHTLWVVYEKRPEG